MGYFLGLWEETHNVTTSPQGLFSIALGTDMASVTHQTVEKLADIEWNTGSLTITTNVTDNTILKGTDPVQIQIWNPSDTLPSSLPSLV